MFKKVLMTVAVSMAFSGLAFAADIKIGIVDMQKAIQETGAGKKAKKDLEEDYNKKKKDIEKREADLKKMNEDLEKKALVLSEDIKAKKQQELQAEMIKYRELVGKSQMDIQKREAELTKPIVDSLRKIIDNIAEKEGFTAILSKAEQNVLWSKAEIDLTNRVIEEFDKQSKKK